MASVGDALWVACKEWYHSLSMRYRDERQDEEVVCTEKRDDGYRKCTQQRDDGYAKCCDWWPCSWGCAAVIWIADIVCVAWTWVPHVVCIAWTSTKYVVREALLAAAFVACYLAHILISAIEEILGPLWVGAAPGIIGRSVDRAPIDLGRLPGREALQAKERLARYNQACGCKEGAAAGLTGLLLYVFASRTGLARKNGNLRRPTFSIGLAVFVASTLIGKKIGLSIVRHQRERYLDDLEARLRMNSIEL